MKVLLLGSTGFIGRNLVEQLKHKYQLLTSTRSELNLLDQAAVDKYFKDRYFDVVVNCVHTGEKSNHDYDIYKAIIKNQSHFKRLIQLGSGAELKKKGSYADNKRAIYEKAKGNKKIVVLRPFGVFGKYEDSKRRFISHAILQRLKGKPITIYQDLKFSYIWVNDLVRIVDWFITHEPKHQFYNISGHQLSLLEIAQKICEGEEEDIRLNWFGMGKEYTCDDSRLLKETGIKYTPFEESLKKLKEYYETKERKKS